jgi:hypothetical protein
MSVSVLSVYSADRGALGLAMPGETHKPNQETWRDWVPPGIDTPLPLITRDELLARLQQRNIDVKLSDLRYWEYEGILPRPERKWDPAVKARRAYYPIPIMASIMALRELQGAGLQLRDITPSLPVAFARATHELSKYEAMVKEHGPLKRDETMSDDDVIDTVVLAVATQSILETVLHGSVLPVLARYARLLDRCHLVTQGAKHTHFVELMFTDATGKPTSAFHQFSIRDDDDRR